jgi:hypothetical protein
MLLPTGFTAAAAEVLFRVRGALIGRAGVVSPLNTGSGAGGGGAGGANFMFWRQPQPPKKIPLATTSPQTSASTTSSVWLALSLTARFRGDSQCNWGGQDSSRRGVRGQRGTVKCVCCGCALGEAGLHASITKCLATATGCSNATAHNLSSCSAAVIMPNTKPKSRAACPLAEVL